MRVSREQFRENREKILQAAARLFRERGFDEVGVADVMKAAGLTHGGFYGHFKSKDDLIAQATGEAARPPAGSSPGSPGTAHAKPAWGPSSWIAVDIIHDSDHLST